MRTTTKFFIVTIWTGLVMCNSSYAQIITTIAGNGTGAFSGDGGPATSASCNFTAAVTRDIYGNLYISDRDNNRIRKVDQSGIISTIAGTGTAGFSGDGGQAINAQLNKPIGIVVTQSGVIYFSDNTNERIRKIDTNGVITTIAGTGVAGFSGDGGQATLAKLNDPWGLALNANEDLFVADRTNDRVRQITISSGVITTVAGNGTNGYSGNGGAATSAAFNRPIAVCFDQSGNMYIADENNHRVRKVNTSGIVNLFAGNGTGTFAGDGGAATSASLYYPSGVGTDNAGNIYIGDRFNQRIRKVNTSGTISTIAGTGTAGFSGDGGNATSAKINYPREIISDGSGNIYIADASNNRVRKITYCSLPTIPIISASQNNFCTGGNTTLTITSGSLNAASDWQWYDASCGVNNIGAGTSINVSPSSTTTYYVRGEGGCVTPYGCASITINVNQIPSQPGTISGNATVCSGSSQTYSISSVAGATSYSWTLPSGWSGTSTTNSISATAGTSSGTISVTANNSCGSSTAQTLSVTVNQIPSQPGTISGNATVCSGSSQTYSISSVAGATSYSWTLPAGWSGTSSTNSLSATAGTSGGTISVTANDGCGSSTAQTLSVSIDIVDTSITINGITLTSNATSATYQWVSCPAFTIINGEINQLYTPSSNGNYAVIVTQNGCIDTSNCYPVMTTGLSSIDDSTSFIIYPNPTTQNVEIKFNNNNQIYSLTILNSQGQLIQTISDIKTDNIIIETKDLSAGVYCFQLQTTGKIMTGKLIVVE